MDIRNYFSLLLRRWKAILVIVVLVVGVSYVSTRQIVQPSYSATLFLSFGVDGAKNVEGYFGGINASDGFAEAVQGWLKDPGVLNDVRELSGNDGLGLSARKQERQNVLITIDNSENEDLAKKNAEIVLKVLQGRLDEFNRSTNNAYAIGLSSISAQVSIPEDKISLTMVVAVFFGLILGVVWAFLFEFLFGRISFGAQARSIIKDKLKDVVDLKDCKDDWKYLCALSSKGKEKTSLVAVGFSPSINEKELGFEKGAIEVFPGNFNFVDGEAFLIIVRLGVSRLSDLKKVISLIDAPITLVVVD